ncbi:SRPBCC domain-containing protein [Agrococcus sp. ARC_14]|uniref:SRPBCC family protein n=1 Tax=Agrococcus sp. ARC_14 TaxID=2919927 RepID=UPI001F06A3FA|nr:SRPBCC domain-containing protein [Agrococcus sp. ARC_14]MCH1882204.1 SRPBCC domain-containing protein [Agrococcus sp. ARC_14]
MSERIEIPEEVERTSVEGFVMASADAVWQLWTTVDGLEQWWWPMFDDASYDVDARDDGLYRFTASSGGVGVQGRYLQLDEGKRMVLSWDWMSGYEDGERREDLVVVDFSELGDGTHVRVTLTGPLDELENMRDGWQDTLTRLEELLDD